MGRSLSPLIGQRTLAMATMYLTRRKDLQLRYEVKVGQGKWVRTLDIVADILDPEKPGERKFGVELEGMKSALTLAEAEKLLRPKLEWLQSFRGLPYPLVLLLFTMEDNAGYYTWLAEPIIKAESPKLKFHDEAHCQILDRASLDEVVERVTLWYDSFYASLSV